VSVVTLAAIAVVATALGFSAFFSVANLVTAPADEIRRQRTRLLRAYVVYYVLISWGLTAAVVFILAWSSNSANPEAVAKPVTYRIISAVSGQASSTSETVVPFRATSGQVNFGCEETKSAVATFTLPAGASFVALPTTKWDNLSNSSSPRATVTTNGNQAVATGTIRGIDYQNLVFARNCPGGGHGELIVEGNYRTSATAVTPRNLPQITSSLSTANPAPARVTLPTTQELNITAIRISVSELEPTPGEPETLELTAQAPSATFRSGKIRATWDIQNRELVFGPIRR